MPIKHMNPPRASLEPFKADGVFGLKRKRARMIQTRAPTRFDSFKIYNPTFSSIIQVDTPFKQSKLTIYTLNGKQLLSQKLAQESSQLDVSDISTGMYIATVSDGIHQLKTKFLIR